MDNRMDVQTDMDMGGETTKVKKVKMKRGWRTFKQSQNIYGANIDVDKIGRLRGQRVIDHWKVINKKTAYENGNHPDGWITGHYKLRIIIREKPLLSFF